MLKHSINLRGISGLADNSLWINSQSVIEQSKKYIFWLFVGIKTQRCLYGANIHNDYLVSSKAQNLHWYLKTQYFPNHLLFIHKYVIHNHFFMPVIFYFTWEVSIFLYSFVCLSTLKWVWFSWEKHTSWFQAKNNAAPLFSFLARWDISYLQCVFVVAVTFLHVFYIYFSYRLPYTCQVEKSLVMPL